MKPWILTVLGLALAGLLRGSAVPVPALAAPPLAPRLVLLVAVDQMRYDYLPRFASAFTGGFRRILRDGAVFTNAHLDHYPSVTAVGHCRLWWEGPDYYGRLYNSAFGNELLVSLAERALEGEDLGRRGATDILALSFSCNDAVGHDKGPHSAEVRDITVRTDLALDRLLDAVDRRVGLARTVVVVTADHGVATVPEEMAAWKMPGGRFPRADLARAATGALGKAFGPGPWLEGRAGSALYLNQGLMAEHGLDPATVERRLASGVETVARVWRAYTRSQLLEGRVPPDPWSRRVLASFDRERSGDVEVLLEPYWMSASSGTTHGTAYSYDTHIPLMVMGPGIRPGRYDRAVVLNDLAPTLATLLGVETPSGSSGQALAEILETGGPPSPAGRAAEGRSP
jgi:arylsulfatase A-like enzyme